MTNLKDQATNVGRTTSLILNPKKAYKTKAGRQAAITSGFDPAQLFTGGYDPEDLADPALKGGQTEKYAYQALPTPPEPPPPPPGIPVADDREGRRAKSRAYADRRRRSGRASTILSEGEGLGG